MTVSSAVLLSATREYFVDDAVVRVAVRLVDARLHFPAGTAVVVRAVPDAVLGQASSVAVEAQATSDSTGMAIVSVTLRAGWFSGAQLNSDGNVTVLVGFADGRQALQSLGQVVLRRQPVFATGTNQVAMMLPLASAFPSQVVSIPIWASAGAAVSTFTFVASVSDGSAARISTITFNSAKWSAVVFASSSTLVAINAQLADPTSAPTGSVPGSACSPARSTRRRRS